MNAASWDAARAKGVGKKILITHPGYLSGANCDTVVRAMAGYSNQVINAAHDAVQSGNDIAAKTFAWQTQTSFPSQLKGSPNTPPTGQQNQTTTFRHAHLPI